MRLLLHWLLTALAVWIVAHVVPGISVSDPVARTGRGRRHWTRERHHRLRPENSHLPAHNFDARAVLVCDQRSHARTRRRVRARILRAKFHRRFHRSDRPEHRQFNSAVAGNSAP